MVGESVLPQRGIAGGDIEAHNTADFEERQQARAHPIRNCSRADAVAFSQRRFIGEAPIRSYLISCFHNRRTHHADIHQGTEMKKTSYPVTLVTLVTDDARAAKRSFSEMGKRSAAARTTPERDRLKAEAIRMHVELDFGINAIEPRIGINKTAIRRWLIAAGCYRVGHRTRRAKNDGAKLIDCSPTDLGRKQIYVHVWQRRAWRDEWKGVAKWDAAKHWHRHPAKQLYINAQTYRKKRMKTG